MNQKTYAFEDTRGLMVTISEDELINKCKEQNIFPLVEEGEIVCEIIFSRELSVNEISRFILGVNRISCKAINLACDIDMEVFGYSDEEKEKIKRILDESRGDEFNDFAAVTDEYYSNMCASPIVVKGAR